MVRSWCARGALLVRAWCARGALWRARGELRCDIVLTPIVSSALSAHWNGSADWEIILRNLEHRRCLETSGFHSSGAQTWAGVFNYKRTKCFFIAKFLAGGRSFLPCDARFGGALGAPVVRARCAPPDLAKIELPQTEFIVFGEIIFTRRPGRKQFARGELRATNRPKNSRMY